MTNQLTLTPTASAAAASTAIRVEVRNLVVTGPDIQSLLSAVEVDMEILPTMDIDSEDMATEMMQMLGRLSTVSSAIEAERKERTAPLLDAQKWLMNGYSPARAQLDQLIAGGKAKLTAYSRAVQEAQRKADEAAAAVRRAEAAAAAKKESDAIAAAQAAAIEAAALRDAGSEQVADAMETKAMVQVDMARQEAAVATRAVFTAPVRAPVTAVKGISGTWKAELTDKAALIQHIGHMIADGDLSLIALLDVAMPAANQMAKLQMQNLKLPGLTPVFVESMAIRKQAVST
jgi:hypothetical protein